LILAVGTSVQGIQTLLYIALRAAHLAKGKTALPQLFAFTNVLTAPA